MGCTRTNNTAMSVADQFLPLAAAQDHDFVDQDRAGRELQEPIFLFRGEVR